MEWAVGGFGVFNGRQESVEWAGAGAAWEEPKLDGGEVAGAKKVVGQAVVDNAGHDLERGFKERYGA